MNLTTQHSKIFKQVAYHHQRLKQKSWIILQSTQPMGKHSKQSANLTSTTFCSLSHSRAWVRNTGERRRRKPQQLPSPSSLSTAAASASLVAGENGKGKKKSSCFWNRENGVLGVKWVEVERVVRRWWSMEMVIFLRGGGGHIWVKGRSEKLGFTK